MQISENLKKILTIIWNLTGVLCLIIAFWATYRYMRGLDLMDSPSSEKEQQVVKEKEMRGTYCTLKSNSLDGVPIYAEPGETAQIGFIPGEKSLSIVLKHGYAPEEKYRSNGIQGPWTDIYDLSATMYKCITGITPAESIQRIIEDTVQPPSALGIPIPSGMEYALMKGLSISQKNRYQNLNDFCQDFYRQSYSPADETVYEPNYNQNYQQNYNQSYEPNYNSGYESGYHSGYVPPTLPPQKKRKGGWTALITGSQCTEAI